jgi:RIO kinase 1
LPSRGELARRAALAAKHDTDQFQRIRPTTRSDWDDDEVDHEASTYLLADQRGPEPAPDWLITDDAARQYDLGVLKTGKEADVHLVERRLNDRVNHFAAKRYRDLDERAFRNDVRYRAARRTGKARVDRAMAKGSRAGMAYRAQQWVTTEFQMLGRLWEAGVAVPYPVQQLGPEIMLELIGSPDAIAPRLVHAHLDPPQTREMWGELVEILRRMVGAGVVHGDLSPYNVLVDGGRLVVIDFPQAVDPIAHPEGISLLERDVLNICGWFSKRGVDCHPSQLIAELIAEAIRP